VTEERALNGRSGEGVVTVGTPVAARSHGSKLRRRSRARFVWLIVFLLVLALPSAVRAAATTLYVDKGNPNCSDAGSGNGDAAVLHDQRRRVEGGRWADGAGLLRHV
jgi:hypothetical protein